jgi:hypothetical protein
MDELDNELKGELCNKLDDKVCDEAAEINNEVAQINGEVAGINHLEYEVNDEASEIEIENDSPSAYIADGIESGKFMSDEEKAKIEKYDKYFTENGKARLNNSMKWGYCVGLAVTAIILLVRIIVTDSAVIPYELFVIMWAMFGTNSLVQATAYKEKKYRTTLLVVAVAEFVCVILFLVLWIMQLCNLL